MKQIRVLLRILKKTWYSYSISPRELRYQQKPEGRKSPSTQSKQIHQQFLPL